MPLRRESSETLYPFVPAAEPGRARVAGLVDAFLFVHGCAETPVPPSGSSGSSGIPGSTSSSGSSVSSEEENYRTVLASLTVGPADNVYVFRSRAPGFEPALRTFTVTRDLGLMRVTAAEDSFSFLVVDSSRVPALPDPGDADLDLELEPSRTVWQLERVNSIRLTNEYREPDPAQRDQVLPSFPDRTILYLDQDDEVLDLVDGYNCHLDYDETTGTLTINGGANLGKGRPTTIPWDRPAIDVFAGIRSINGLNVDGNVELRFGQGLAPDSRGGLIIIRVLGN